VNTSKIGYYACCPVSELEQLVEELFHAETDAVVEAARLVEAGEVNEPLVIVHITAIVRRGVRLER
jgi:hypothetical protein